MLNIIIGNNVKNKIYISCKINRKKTDFVEIPRDFAS